MSVLNLLNSNKVPHKAIGDAAEAAAEGTSTLITEGAIEDVAISVAEDMVMEAAEAGLLLLTLDNPLIITNLGIMGKMVIKGPGLA